MKSTDTKLASQDMLLDDLNRMLRDAEAVQRPITRERSTRPIMAMRCGHEQYSLAAHIVQHREKAVLVSNDTCQFWLPRSQVIRVTQHQVIVTGWIVARKLHHLELRTNHQLREQEAQHREAAAHIPPGGFQYKFDRNI